MDVDEIRAERLRRRDAMIDRSYGSEESLAIEAWYSAQHQALIDARTATERREGVERTLGGLVCEACGKAMERTGKRGRPAKRCPECRGVRGAE